MRSKLLTCLAAAAATAAAAFWCAAHYRGLIHFLGIDTQASDNYDFTSGIGPMLLTAAGMTTLISGLWHGHHCHAPGCWRIGRHRIDGTPWCNRHHRQARHQDQATLADVVAGLEAIGDMMQDLIRLQGRDEP